MVRDELPLARGFLVAAERRMAKLYFYYSAMNAGKTTALLQSAHNYRERGMSPLLFKPRLDDREGAGRIRSRIGLESAAVDFSTEDNLFEEVRNHLARQNVHCVLVDEAQFLTREQVFQLTEVVDRLGIPVLCFGLRTDFQGELFEGSRYLLAWGDQLEELKTICHTGRKATMVVRVDDQGYALREGSQVEIGGNERYISVSRKEFKEVFFGGKRIRLIDPLEQSRTKTAEVQEELLD
jgi:thymidine kinase